MGTSQKTCKVKNILISQPAPADFEKSPYKPVSDKYGLKFTFKKLFQVEGISAIEFRKNKINLLDYTAVILTSRNAVDHYFRMAKEMRAQIPISMKFICSSESVAYYIQTYIQYRKRKIFFGKQTTEEMMDVVLKHKNEKFLFPCQEDSYSDVPAAFAKAKLPLKKAPMYRSVAVKVAQEIDIEKIDMILMFSPMGIKSLFENYPDFKQGKKLIGIYGHSVADSAHQAGLTVNLAAPTPTSSSMAEALGEFLADLTKHGGDLSKISPHFEYRPNAETVAETEPAKGKKKSATAKIQERSVSPTKKVESRVAANKAAALAVMADKKNNRSKAKK